MRTAERSRSTWCATRVRWCCCRCRTTRTVVLIRQYRATRWTAGSGSCRRAASTPAKTRRRPPPANARRRSGSSPAAWTSRARGTRRLASATEVMHYYRLGDLASAAPTTLRPQGRRRGHPRTRLLARRGPRHGPPGGHRRPQDRVGPDAGLKKRRPFARAFALMFARNCASPVVVGAARLGRIIEGTSPPLSSGAVERGRPRTERRPAPEGLQQGIRSDAEPTAGSIRRAPARGVLLSSVFGPYAQDDEFGQPVDQPDGALPQPGDARAGPFSAPAVPPLVGHHLQSSTTSPRRARCSTSRRASASSRN